MNKILLVFAIFAVFIMSCGNEIKAQSNPTEATVTARIKSPTNLYFYGTTADTMSNASSDTLIIRVKGDDQCDFNIKSYIDYVSGSITTDSVLTLQSIDGVNWESTGAGDTIAAATVVADGMQSGTITLSDYNYPYLGIVKKQSGTAVQVPKIYMYGRRN